MERFKKLPENLKQLRKQYHYTQKYVAQHIGITHQSYQAYESGKTIPAAPNLIKLAEFYDMSIDDLLE